MVVHLAIYLGLIAIGFYFGKFFGAVGLPLLYFSLLRNQRQRAHNKPNVNWAYKVLQLEPNADWAMVQQARKRLLNQCHPDKLPPFAGDAEKRQATAKMNDINRAFNAIQEQYEKR